MQSILVRFAVIIALCGGARGRASGLRGEAHHVGDGVDASAVRGSLQEALDAVLALGKGNSTERIKHIEDELFPTFLALPKTAAGRLGHRAVQYLVKSFFNKEHGWTLMSLDTVNGPEGEQINKGLLQAKVPALMEAVLEAKEHGKGLSIQEVAALVTALEKLILDESVQLLNMAYRLNGFSESDLLDEYQLEEVLVSYLALFASAKKQLDISVEDHHRWKQRLAAAGKFKSERSFAEDSIMNFNYARQGSVSPFHAVQYSFDTSGQIVDRMASQYGRWQDESCKVMRDALEAKDTTGTGRVTVEDFHSIKNVPHFNLNEDVAALRKMGVLDESIPGKPMVRMANYVTDSQNCGAFSNFYHVCCINTCMSIMNILEGQFQAPAVAPDLLLQALDNMTVTGDKEFNIAASPLLGPAGPALKERLAAIAQRHEGLVPLHGRLFETWLHFAFPRDCPLPAKQVQAVPANEPQMPEADLKEIAPRSWASDMDVHLPRDETQWNEDDEALPFFEDMLPTVNRESSVWPWIHSTIQLLAMGGACYAFARVTLEAFTVVSPCLARKTGKHAMTYKRSAKKNDDLLLPMSF